MDGTEKKVTRGENSSDATKGGGSPFECCNETELIAKGIWNGLN